MLRNNEQPVHGLDLQLSSKAQCAHHAEGATNPSGRWRGPCVWARMHRRMSRQSRCAGPSAHVGVMQGEELLSWKRPQGPLLEGALNLSALECS